MFFKKKKKIEPSTSGVYLVEGKTISPLSDLPDNDSIKGIAEALFPGINHRTVITFNSLVFECIVFVRRTKTPMFFMVKNKYIIPEYSDLKSEINKIDWGFENRQIDFEDANINKL